MSDAMDKSEEAQKPKFEDADLSKLKGKPLVMGKPDFSKLTKAVILSSKLKQSTEWKDDKNTGKKFQEARLEVAFESKIDDVPVQWTDTFGTVKVYDDGSLYCGPQSGFANLVKVVGENFDYSGDITSLSGHLDGKAVKVITKEHNIGDKVYKKTVIGQFL